MGIPGIPYRGSRIEVQGKPWIAARGQPRRGSDPDIAPNPIEKESSS